MNAARSFNGQRLRDVRAARGLTLREVADRIQVTPGAISSFEVGRKFPAPRTVEELAGVLDVDPSFFARAEPAERTKPLFFRSMASATKKARHSAERYFGWLCEIATVLDEHVEFAPFRLSGASSDANYLGQRQIEDAAIATRAAMGMGLGPIGCVAWSLENAGVLISEFDLHSEALDAFSDAESSPRPIVVLNSVRDSETRRRFNLAHELAHVVLHRTCAKDALSAATRFSEIEVQANCFAGAFLLPEETFLNEVRFPIVLDGLLDLKPRWGASVGAMIHRLHDLDRISDEDYKRLWALLCRRGWRRFEPYDGEPTNEGPSALPSALRLAVEHGAIHRRDFEASLGLFFEEVNRLCGVKDADVGADQPRQLLPFRRAAK